MPKIAIPKTKKPKTKKREPKKGEEKKEREEKKKTKTKVLEKETKEPKLLSDSYFEAIGRRKTAVARVRLFTRGEKVFLVNNKPFDLYFPTIECQQIVSASLIKMKCLGRFRVLVRVKGGGFRGQAEAVRHGIARALVLFNLEFKKRLRRVGYLTRDARIRERKKFGLKRARRAPQWSKR